MKRLLGLLLILLLIAVGAFSQLEIDEENPDSNSAVFDKKAPPTTPVPSVPEVDIPPTPQRIAIEDLESQIFQLINQERLEAGCKPMLWQDEFHAKARAYSEYMATTGDFVHSDFNCYENLFWSPSWQVNNKASLVVREWMLSRGHRATLLTTATRYCGVGVAECDDGFYVTYMAD